MQGEGSGVAAHIQNRCILDVFLNTQAVFPLVAEKAALLTASRKNAVLYSALTDDNLLNCGFRRIDQGGLLHSFYAAECGVRAQNGVIRVQKLLKFRHNVIPELPGNTCGDYYADDAGVDIGGNAGQKVRLPVYDSEGIGVRFRVEEGPAAHDCLFYRVAPPGAVYGFRFIEGKQSERYV